MHILYVLLHRFNLQCEPEQLLSYSVERFNLEGKSICSGQPQCLDWVQHQMSSLQGSNPICGIGELGEIHVDGSNDMLVEFVSNRRSEDDGFEYFITCIAPGFDSNAVGSGTGNTRRQVAQCTSPPRERQSILSPLIGVQHQDYVHYIVIYLLSICYKPIWNIRADPESAYKSITVVGGETRDVLNLI